VADGSKVGRVCLARICSVSDVDEFVTDRSADPTVLAAIEAAIVPGHVCLRAPRGRFRRPARLKR